MQVTLETIKSRFVVKILIMKRSVLTMGTIVPGFGSIYPHIEKLVLLAFLQDPDAVLLK